MIGIWNYKKYFEHAISQDFQLTLGEGTTPLENISINGMQILVKREDQNPSRSFKDRTIAFQLSYYLQSGIENFCISSSGNAGTSLLNLALKYLEINVVIFLGKNISENKLQNISELSKISIEELRVAVKIGEIRVRSNILLKFSKNPKADCMVFARETGYHNLRASEDPIALEGYKSLGVEIADLDFDSLYILVSSATSLLGMINGIRAVNLKKYFEINIIQTPSCYPMARKIDPNVESKIQNENSEVNCIVDLVAKRSEDVVKMAQNYELHAQIIQNNDIMVCRNALKEAGVEFSQGVPSSVENLSANTLAPLAIWYRLHGKGNETKTKPLVIFSGI